MKERHIWSMADDILAFYIYRFGTKAFGCTYKDISKKLGMNISSMKMRVKNYRYLEIGTGLSDVSGQSVEVFECLKDIEGSEFKGLVEELFYTN